MKYFKAINKDDVTDECYVSCSKDLSPEAAAEHLGLEVFGYKLIECSKEEFETMTQDVNDFIINVGKDRSSINPFDSAHTEDEAIEKAQKYCEDWKCVEVVYMPCDNEDINEIVWSYYDFV
jgi:hypothetical protein